MSEKELPTRPDLDQYKKQAKELVKSFGLSNPQALERARRHHPRLHKLPTIQSASFTLTDAQLVLAREHGFESWPKFAKYIETQRLIQSVAALTDPVSAFIEEACIPRHSWHGSGTLEHAEMILSRYPHVAGSNIFTAAILGNESAVRTFLTRDPKAATATGGPHGWDALTYLCFSRYLRIDRARSATFVRTAEMLLDAGANAKTGWYETIDHPNPRRILESAIYGAAGIAQQPELTRLLLERGADPNDEETPYHVPESDNNDVTKVLLDSGKLNETSLATMLLRKTDWHDEEGLQLLLEHGANPNAMTRWGNSALHHALQRDNQLHTIELLLNHDADPSLKNNRDGRSAIAIAAHRGRGDVLTLFEQRGIALNLHGVELLIAACAKGDHASAQLLATQEPSALQRLLIEGGTLLAEFAGNGNVEGIKCLLDLGVNAAALYRHGDGYFEIATNSTALHVAAWRMRPAVVKELISRGTPVNALDARNHTALQLAVKACVASHWKNRRTPESVDALLRAGASLHDIEIPSGYNEVDTLLRQYST